MTCQSPRKLAHVALNQEAHVRLGDHGHAVGLLHLVRHGTAQERKEEKTDDQSYVELAARPWRDEHEHTGEQELLEKVDQLKPVELRPAHACRQSQAQEPEPKMARVALTRRPSPKT